MSTLWGILVAVLVFGIMIFLHELGHFLAARACHVTVLEFAVGMGPKLFSRTSKRSGTVYSLRLLPIGGFTAMLGEDEENDDPHAFGNRPRHQRLAVLFAGAFMNIVSGVIVMFVYLLLTGNVGSNIVYDFHETNTSGQWLKAGDEIVEINGKHMADYTDIVNTITLDGIEPMDIVVIRDGRQTVLEDVVFASVEKEGILVGELDFRFLGVKPSLKVLLGQTVTQSYSAVKMIYKTLFDFIGGRFGLNGVSGPVGTVSVISEATTYGFTSILYLFTFISLNLGVMNLLPLPALDGGRILLTVVEMIRGKALNPKVEGYIHFAGLAVLLLLMAIVTFSDIVKLF